MINPVPCIVIMNHVRTKNIGSVTMHCLILRRRLRSSPHGQLLINLCLALLGLYAMFICAIHSTVIPALCAAVAALLQYFFLVTFMIMAAEAIDLYMKLVVVLGQGTQNYVLKASLISWSEDKNSSLFVLVVVKEE